MSGATDFNSRSRLVTVLPLRVLLTLLLWGIFFIRFPPLVAAGLGLGALIALHHVFIFGQIDRINILVFLNFALWFYSGFLSGALSVATLLDPSYYTNEGRIFVTYFAFFTVSSSLVGIGALRAARRHMAAMAVLGLLLYCVWTVARPALLSVGHAHNFSGFLTSHTGSGTFFAEISVFLAVYGARMRSQPCLLLGIASLLPVLGSASREALVALLAVLAWYLIRAVSLRAVIVSALLLGTLIAEGFIAVEAMNTAEVKEIGKNVLNLAKALGVGTEVTKRTNSIISFANTSTGRACGGNSTERFPT